MRRMNKKLSILVIAMILMLGIGFAAITTTLTITGNTGISGDSSNFQNNVFFYSADLTSTGLRTEDHDAAQPKLNGNTMKFTVPATSALKVVGDKIEVNYTIRNESNYNAIIAVPTVESTATDFLDFFTVTHSRTDNLNLGVNTTSENQKLTLTLKKTYADTIAKNFTFTVKINATAVGSQSVGAGGNHGVATGPESFETDDWDTIVSAVQDGDFSAYNVGDTRSIDLGSLGTHTLRIVNTSTPSECESDDFSQTGCGFVLEFVSLMSCSTGTSDGWLSSNARTKFNNSSFFESIPEELMDAVIDTKVISGGSNNIYVTEDKFYLLAAHEVFENDENSSSYISEVDCSWNYTRQLDYYRINNVTVSNFSVALKKNSWILRSIDKYYGADNGYFLYIPEDESEEPGGSANGVCYCTPAFRIG